MNTVIKKFPHRSPARIVGEPTYQSINGLLKKLYANAASIPSTLGGGRHGHVGLLMTTTLYATLSDTEYIFPENTGPGCTVLVSNCLVGTRHRIVTLVHTISV